MIFEELRLENFGAFGREHAIPLSPKSADKPIILIGAKNGSGKTTILEALQLVLYGRSAPHLKSTRIAYHRYLSDMINRNASGSEGAAVSLRFRVPGSAGSATYDVTRTWNIRRKNVVESFTVCVDGRMDPVLAENWTDEVSRFLPPSLADLFLFDGEKIQALANPQDSAMILRGAVSALLGVDLVEKLSLDLAVLARRKRKSQVSSDTREKVAQLENELLENATKLKAMQAAASELATKVDGAEANLRRVLEQYKAYGGDLFEEREVIAGRHRELVTQLAEIDERLRDLAAGILPLSLIRSLLEGTYEQARAEIEANRARIQLAEISQRDTALLGWMHEECSDARLLERVEAYLRKSRGALEQRTFVESYVELDETGIAYLGALLNHDLTKTMEDARALLSRRADLNANLEEVERTLARVPDQEGLAQLLERKAAAVAKYEALRNELAVLEREIQQVARLDADLRSKRDSLLKRVQEDEEQRAADLRIIEHSERAQATLKRYQTRLVELRIGKLEEIIARRFAALIRKADFLGGIKIDRDSYSPQLFDRRGALVPLERLSAGERQLLAVALLWGLSEATGRAIPVVVDTPLGRLDKTHRDNLMSHYFPNASHQVLILSTDAEIDRSSYNRLATRISRTYLLEYEEGSSSTSIIEGYFGGAA